MTTTRRNPIMERAAVTIALALGLPADAVTISRGERDNDNGLVIHQVGGGDHPTTQLFIRIQDPSSELMTSEELRAKVLAGLNTLQQIKDIALTVPDENTAADLHTKLKAATEGTKFDSRLLTWPGFNPEIAKKDWRLGDHAIDNVSEGPYGVEFNLAIPTDKHTDHKKLLEELKGNVTARLPAIREMLTERALKYVKQNMLEAGKTADEITAAETKTREDMAKLVIQMNANDDFGHSLNITLRSPEQVTAVTAAGGKVENWGAKPDNADALRASNPLHQLTSSITDEQREKNPDLSAQLPKAVGRSFLFAGEKAADEFPLVAGRRDIRNAILKGLVDISKNHPERAALVAEIMESNLFKNHSAWGEHKENALSLPSITQNAGKPGEVQVWINLPEAKLQTTVLKLADLAPPTPASILAAHRQTLAATQPNADMMSLATPESAAEASTAAAAPQQSSGIAGVLEKFLPSGWVGRTKQAATSNSAQIG